MTQQPRVPWQVKYLALVLIWGSSFLLMKVGLESLSAVQISGLRILSGAAVLSVLLLAKGGRLPTGARVWGHLFVCGFFLGALPFTLFALSETRISSALAGIGNATTPIVAVLATIAILPGERVTGSRLVAVLVGFLGVVTIMQPWTSVDRPDLVGFSMALVGGASYGIGWTYNRRFLSGVDLGGLSQPAATLLTALVLMVPVMLGWAAFQPEGLAAIWSYDAPDSGTWFWLPLACVLVLGLVGTGFAYMLQFDVVRGAGPVIGSTITYLIPVVSVLLGVFVLGESLGPWQLVGFAIVLSAAFVVNRKPRTPEAAAVQRAGAGRQPRSLTSSVVAVSSSAASAAAQLRRASTATTTETSPSAMTASRPPTTSRGGPEVVAPVAVPRRGEHGPGGQHRLGDRDAARARAAGSSPRAGPRRRARADHHAHQSRPTATSTKGAPTRRTRPRSPVSVPERNATRTQSAMATTNSADQVPRSTRPGIRQRSPGAREGSVGRDGGGRHPGAGSRRSPLGRGVHLAAQDLAGGALGQLGHDPHLAGVLVGGDPLLGERR